MLRIDPQQHPVSKVIWVSLEKVVSNDYNPNKVAHNEMRLLAISILKDGFTQPIVTVYDDRKSKYVIVDGFHRYYTVLNNEAVRKSTGGMVPVVVLHNALEDRMASTIRHNRARGKHTTVSMGVIVEDLRRKGWDDEHICNELGLEAEELVRLQHMTGVAELFRNRKYGKSWESVAQIKQRREAK